MDSVQRTTAGLVAWVAAVAAAAGAAEDSLRRVEGQLAIERAKALADKKLFARAKAILKALPQTCPDVAEEAKKAAAGIARRAAAAEQGAVPDEYRKALGRSRRTGRPMLLLFGREACGLCKFTKASLKSSKLASLKRRLIEVHLDIDSAANRPLVSKFRAGKEMRMLPFIFYVAPTEELLGHSTGGQNVDALSPKFRDVLRAMGPPLSPSRLARAAKALKRASTQMDAGKCGPALRTCRALAKLKGKSQLAADAKVNIEIIEGLGSSILAQARRAAGQGKFADAVPRLVVLQRDFAGTDAAKEAAEQLEQLKDNPDAKAQLDALAAVPKREPDAPTEPAGPDKPTPKPRPATGSAGRAQSMLRMARNYIINKRPDLAEPLLKRVVEKFPDTDAAREAAKLLRELP